MRSKVAEEVRRQQWEETQAMPLDERIADALRRGQEGRERYMQATGLPRHEAWAELERNAQQGRRKSNCLERVIDASAGLSAHDPG